MRRLATVAVVFIALASGCTGHRPHASQPTQRSPALHVTRAAWHAVVNDWYYGGINRPHSCAAVRAAMRHLPQDGGIGTGRVRAALMAYEREVCG